MRSPGGLPVVRPKAPRRDDRAAVGLLPKDRNPAMMRRPVHSPQNLNRRTTPHTSSPDNRTRMRRTGPASRPSGRYAVGLRPSPDPAPLPARDQNPIGAKKKGPAITLDRPRSFRDDLRVRPERPARPSHSAHDLPAGAPHTRRPRQRQQRFSHPARPLPDHGPSRAGPHPMPARCERSRCSGPLSMQFA
jgi:hypothetical protein